VSLFFFRFRGFFSSSFLEKKLFLLLLFSLPAQKVAVLPVPDWACWMTSSPLANGTIPFCWMAEGFSKPY